MRTKSPQLALVIPEFDNWIRENVSNICRQGVAKKTRDLSRLIMRAYLRSNPHVDALRFGSLNGIDPVHQLQWGLTISSSSLRRKFGGNDGQYVRYIQAFFHFEQRNRGYSKTERLTKVYVLKDSVIERLEKCLLSNVPAYVIDARTGTRVRRESIPHNGVVRTNSSGIFVPSIINIGIEHVDRAILILKKRVEAATAHKKRRPTLDLRRLYVARKWVSVLGGVPNMYADYRPLKKKVSGNGRLYAAASFNIQRLRRGARAALMDGLRWYEYDLKAAHPTILLALTEYYMKARVHLKGSDHFECVLLRDYLENTNVVRSELADELDTAVSRIKLLITATAYGMPLSVRGPSAGIKASALFKALGGGAQAMRAKRSTYYRVLKEEMECGRKLIIGHHLSSDDNVVINAQGKRKSVYYRKNGRRRKRPLKTLMSFALVGYERWALEVMCSGRKDVVAVIHDGFISKGRRSVEEMQRELSIESVRRFGFDLGLRIGEKSLDKS